MLRRSRPDLLVDLALLAVAAAWGASFLSAKELIADVGLPAANALRFLVAAGAAAAICLVARRRLPRGRGLVVAIVLGGSQAAVIGLETWGVSLTSATNAGLLISLSLVLTPVLECVVTRSWLPRGFFVAAVAAVVGVALLVSGDGLRPPGPGDLLVIGAAVVRAIHVTASGRLTRGRDDDSLGVVTVQLVVGSVVFAAMAGPALPAAARSLDAASIAHVLFLGLVCSVFAFAVQLWAVRRTSAARASILMGTEPVWALLVGVVVAAEPLGIAGLGGAVLIVAASHAGQTIERRHRHGDGSSLPRRTGDDVGWGEHVDSEGMGMRRPPRMWRTRGRRAGERPTVVP